ncbi:CBS domain-containing protein [Allosalinactinospora lopnorensis]|uniref:CBS domain-containing protein n=1 Tax=Allosalinactinospora lopnorensis TaxID=1352348 RepID=UPI000623FFDC|nr:CBS domain-containing protein [Allosalinactinospora lopnorensis]
MNRTVRDVMTPDVVSTSSETPIKDIARLMLWRDVSALPVVEGGRVVGIVSETDLVHHEEFAPERPGDEYHEPMRARLRRTLGSRGSAQRKARAENARELMTRDVVTVGPEETVVAAARVMARHDVKQLPIVDERGHLAGMLSRRDLLRVFVRPDGDIARDIGAAFAVAPAWLDPGRIRFSVDDGVVSLEGRVEQHSHCAILAQLTRGVDGVVGVHSKLTWDVDDMLPPRMPYTP